MLARVGQLSDTVQKLKEYGHLLYLKWEVTLPCSVYVKNLESLDKEIGKHEQHLSHWIEYVWRCRYHFSELNFYTTSQLITLREELNKVKKEEGHKISLQVFHLLNSAIGKPLESELIVRKALKGEVHTGECEMNYCKEPLKTEQSQSTELELEPEAPSKVIQARSKVQNDASMCKLYDESVQLGHEEYLILQALLHENITDIFEMMDWYNDLSDEDNERYQKEWMVNGTDQSKGHPSNASNSPLQSGELSSDTFDEIDVSHVASYFLKGVDKVSFERYHMKIVICVAN